MHDVFGREIQEGDKVAYAVRRGNSSALVVGRFIRDTDSGRAVIQPVYDSWRTIYETSPKRIVGPPLVLVG